MQSRTQLSAPPAHPLLGVLDQYEFGALVEPHRRALQAHCYRMVGSVQEAEDLVQDTLLRAWQRRASYKGLAPLRAWLYRIATNTCLDAIKRRPRRTIPLVRQDAATLDEPIPAALTEPIWLEPFPDDLLASEDDNPEVRFSAQENITLAFLTCLQLLPPRQRAVLILRDVLGWHAEEVAEALDLTVPGVKSALHRARTTLTKYRSSLPTHDLPARAPTEAIHPQLERYVRAWERADVQGLLQLLKADATFSMPPIPSWYRGREVIGGLVAATIFSGDARGRWRLRPTRANQQPSFALYRCATPTTYHFYGIQVVTFAGVEIADIITFRDPALARPFAVPPTVEEES